MPEQIDGICDSCRHRQEILDRRRQVTDSCHRTQCVELLDFWSQLFVRRKGGEGYQSSLRMANVEEWGLRCFGQYVINHGWKVVGDHLIEVKAPEVQFVGWQNFVRARVSVSADIAEPDIEASISENEGKAFIGGVVYPGAGAVQKSVLEEDSRPGSSSCKAIRSVKMWSQVWWKSK